jgi:hypothetical protein
MPQPKPGIAAFHLMGRAGIEPATLGLSSWVIRCPSPNGRQLRELVGKWVTAGANPMALKRGIEQGVDAVVENLKTQSKEISGKEDIARVASISSREREIGDVIADAIEKVGKDGVVNVEDLAQLDGEAEILDGGDGAVSFSDAVRLDGDAHAPLLTEISWLRSSPPLTVSSVTVPIPRT